MFRKIKQGLSEQFYRTQHLFARHRFNQAAATPDYLPDTHFKILMRRYSKLKPAPFHDYSLSGMKKRAGERCQMLDQIESLKDKDVLEIGAADGFVLERCLSFGARSCINVDVENTLHEEVKNAGVRFHHASAETMNGLVNSSFDWIFSFSALEHIRDVRAVIWRSLDFLKSGGTLYFEAGPLYYSPWGYHYYSILKIPYIQILFRETLLRQYAKSHGMDFPFTNGHPASVYSNLVKSLPDGVKVLSFEHGYDWCHADLILKYPGVFRSKRVDFDDFFIDTVKIVLRKNK